MKQGLRKITIEVTKKNGMKYYIRTWTQLDPTHTFYMSAEDSAKKVMRLSAHKSLKVVADGEWK